MRAFKKTNNICWNKRALAWAMALVLVLPCVFILSGCTNVVHYGIVKNKALKYYRDKYNVTDVRIENSYKAGVGDFFGIVRSDNRGYELSDGYRIYWNDYEKEFSDNRQAEEIAEAFKNEIMEPLLREFSFPLKTTSYDLYSNMDQIYDVEAYTEYYDGDIKELLTAEKPKLRGLNIALETRDREACEKQIERFYDSVKEYFSDYSYIYIYIIDEGLEDLSGDSWSLDPVETRVLAEAYLDFDDDVINWYRQKYIEIIDGIYITSWKRDFSFKEGDVILEEIGTCEIVQKMIDDCYYSLPDEDPANIGVEYHEPDKKHIDHVVLDNTESPCYKLKMSQRVLDALDKDGKISVFFLDKRDKGFPLMEYYPKDVGSDPWGVYKTCSDSKSEGDTSDINLDYYYFFGTYKTEPYEGE